jgi:hypothetical protein
VKLKNIIDKLLQKLNSEFDPEIVPIKLEEYSTERNCFNNVNKKIKADGGKIHYGWILHKNEFFYEAERHAVWENEKEDLIDLTPQSKDSINSVLFVSDNNNFIYHSQYLPNVRVNLTKNNVVNDYIYLLNRIDHLYSFSKRKNQFEIEIAEPIKLLIDHLTQLSDVYFTFLKARKNERSKCFCDSQKIYKNCHKLKTRSETEKNIEMLKTILKKQV